MAIPREAAKRLSLLPERIKTNGPRTGAHLDSAAQKCGDVWWKCGNEVAKILYSRIDEQYDPHKIMTDKATAAGYNRKKSDARRILQENRNDVFEAVLPLFSVTLRSEGQEQTEADVHAHGYLVNNLFRMLIDTYIAWADELVAPDQAESTRTLIRNIGEVQLKRLEGMLLNFAFEFRPVQIKR